MEKQLSKDLRSRIVTLHKDGQGYKKIGNTLKLRYSTVAMISEAEGHKLHTATSRFAWPSSQKEASSEDG